MLEALLAPRVRHGLWRAPTGTITTLMRLIVDQLTLCVVDKADAEQCQEALEKGLFGPLGRLAFRLDLQVPQQPLKALAVGVG